MVFYTLSNLQHCLNQGGEVSRSKQVTMERAKKRSQKIDPRVKNG